MASNIGFFLDTISSWGNTPDGSTIIGEASVSLQGDMNDATPSRIVGISAALAMLGPSGTKTKTVSSSLNWDQLIANQAEISSASGKDKATLILQYGLMSDELSGRGSGTDWFYAQNFSISDASDTIENWAQVATMLWAVKTAYPDIKRLPVFDSYFVKSLNIDKSTVSLVNEKLDILGIPELSEIDDVNPNGWNMISVLHENGLIDGFIGDLYTVGTEGKYPTDAKDFYKGESPLNYAWQSTYSNLVKESPLPISSEFYDTGEMPLQASIDFNGDLTPPKGFDPASYLTPTPRQIGKTVQEGTSNQDSIIGSNSNELLLGYGADDVIQGRKGNDSLDGGPGSDKLWGGEGADIFVKSSGRDIVYDFEIGKDFLSGFGDSYTVYWHANDTLVFGHNGGEFLLKNVSSSEFVNSIDTTFI